jgi:hypothetical protein
VEFFSTLLPNLFFAIGAAMIRKSQTSHPIVTSRNPKLISQYPIISVLLSP